MMSPGKVEFILLQSEREKVRNYNMPFFNRINIFNFELIE